VGRKVHFHREFVVIVNCWVLYFLRSGMCLEKNYTFKVKSGVDRDLSASAR